MSTEAKTPAYEVGQRVTIVEHDDATRRPKPGGGTMTGEVVRAAEGSPYVVLSVDGFMGLQTYWRESGWPAWTARFTWRIVTAQPVTAPSGAEEDR